MSGSLRVVFFDGFDVYLIRYLIRRMSSSVPDSGSLRVVCRVPDSARETLRLVCRVPRFGERKASSGLTCT